MVPLPRFFFPSAMFYAPGFYKIEQSVRFQVGAKAGLGFLQIFTKDLVRKVFVT